MVDKLVQKFQQLTEREQLLVIISAIVVVFGIFWGLIWSPLNSALDSSQQSVEARKSELAWVKKNANKAVQLRSSGGSKVTLRGSLTQAVNQTASRVQIAISRMQPQGDELKVWVDQAPFNDVLSWLQAMEKRGVRIIDVDFAQADVPGHIKIRSLKLGKS